MSLLCVSVVTVSAKALGLLTTEAAKAQIKHMQWVHEIRCHLPPSENISLHFQILLAIRSEKGDSFVTQEWG